MIIVGHDQVIIFCTDILPLAFLDCKIFSFLPCCGVSGDLLAFLGGICWYVDRQGKTKIIVSSAWWWRIFFIMISWSCENFDSKPIFSLIYRGTESLHSLHGGGVILVYVILSASLSGASSFFQLEKQYAKSFGYDEADFRFFFDNTIQNNKANYWLWAPRAGHICRSSVGVVCDLFCSWRHASRICWQTINTVRILKLMFGTGGRILETHSAEVNNIIVTESNIILMLCLGL